MRTVFVVLAGADAESLEVVGTFCSVDEAQGAVGANRRHFALFVIQQLRVPATAYDSSVRRAAQLVGRLT